MNRIAASIALALPLAVFSVSHAGAAVSSCELAKTEVEIFVCQDHKLRNLDEQVLTTFGRAIMHSPKPERHEVIIGGQVDFQNRLEKCGKDATCLKESYSARINELIDLILRAK